MENQVHVRSWPITTSGWGKKPNQKVYANFVFILVCYIYNKQTAQRLMKNSQNIANNSGQNTKFH